MAKLHFKGETVCALGITGALILGPGSSSDLYTKHRLGAFPPSARCDSCTGTVPPAEASVFQSGDRSPLIRFFQEYPPSTNRPEFYYGFAGLCWPGS